MLSVLARTRSLLAGGASPGVTVTLELVWTATHQLCSAAAVWEERRGREVTRKEGRVNRTPENTAIIDGPRLVL